ncbi:hypothetical protein BOTBODRAFT_33316, partial [Botryobasidium botryosum FD-172 SS1]
LCHWSRRSASPLTSARHLSAMPHSHLAATISPHPLQDHPRPPRSLTPFFRAPRLPMYL